jgi:hypothetical protein
VTSGSLPTNLSLSTAGVLSGTPTGSATANFTVQVNDGFSQTDTQPLSLTIVAAATPLTITTATLPPGKVGDAYGTVTPTTPVTLAASGGTTPYTWSTIVTPPLPTGLSIDAAGTISGTPQAGTNGTTSHQFTVSDSTTGTANTTLSLTINP